MIVNAHPYRLPSVPNATVEEQIQAALKQQEQAAKNLELMDKERKLLEQEERLLKKKETIGKMEKFASFVKSYIAETLLSQDFLRGNAAAIKLPGSDEDDCSRWWFSSDLDYDEVRLVASILEDELCQYELCIGYSHLDTKPKWYSFKKSKSKVAFTVGKNHLKDVLECESCKRKTTWIIYSGIGNKQYCNRCYWLRCL